MDNSDKKLDLILEKVGHIEVNIARIDERQRVNAHKLVDLEKACVELGNRVDALEKWRTFLAGISASVGAAIAYLFKGAGS